MDREGERQQDGQAQQQEQPWEEEEAEALGKAARRLSAASQPLYTRLFVPISQQECGSKFLVDMRADLLQVSHSQPACSHPCSLFGLEMHEGCWQAERRKAGGRANQVEGPLPCVGCEGIFYHPGGDCRSTMPSSR